ncbi:MAG: hypothetical protein ACI865_001192 [Flavobacteriaceae bacterium]|jgi:hypothetical protein
MVLMGVSWVTTMTNLLTVSLIILVIIIGYRRLLRYLGRDTPFTEDYCVLSNLEEDPAAGELEFYFTSTQIKKFSLSILNEEMELVETVASKECFDGGNIIRYDSSKLKNGHYFYCLQTDNQKSMKKMQVFNA